MTPANFQQLSNFIWSVADLLRGPYRPPQYERVMLPLTVLRRFDCVREATKKTVLAQHTKLEGKNGQVIDRVLNSRTKGEDGQPPGFHNHSALDFQALKGDPDNVGRHLIDYINGFSENVRKIFEYLNVWLPLPPLSEQRGIVAHVMAERERTGALEKSLLKSITLLRERRSALITAAVTSQIDPKEMAA